MKWIIHLSIGLRHRGGEIGVAAVYHGSGAPLAGYAKDGHEAFYRAACRSNEDADISWI